MAVLDLLGNYTVQTVALGAGLLGVVSGVLGCFALLRRQSLLGDGISHAALPGVVLAFLLTGEKDSLLLLLGALVTGLLATWLIGLVVRRSPVAFDSALALMLSSFFGLGLVLLTYVQRLPNANQAGLNSYLYGQAATLLQSEVQLTAICGLMLLSLVALFWKEWKLMTFDPLFAQSLGLAPSWLSGLLSAMVVLAILLGLQTVGVVLMSALLIAPGVAARQWSHSLGQMVCLAGILGGLSGVLGTLCSATATALPTGPLIVLWVTSIALISLLVAPGRGMLARLWRRSACHRQWRRKVN